jgi:hypothetical protein
MAYSKAKLKSSGDKGLIPFKGIKGVYSENHTKPINTKYSVTDC